MAKAEKDLKLCKDCKHRASGGRVDPACLRLGWKKEPVWGKLVPVSVLSCYDEREWADDRRHCSEVGRFWEPV